MPIGIWKILWQEYLENAAKTTEMLLRDTLESILSGISKSSKKNIGRNF